MTLAIPPSTGAGNQTCTTIALLGSRGLSFHAKVAGVEDDPLNDELSATGSGKSGFMK